MCDQNQKELEASKQYVNDKEVNIKAGQPEKPRLDPKDLLPGYMLRLTGGYEYRTCA